MTALTITLVIAGMLLNLMIWVLVSRTVTKLSPVADRASMGDLEMRDFGDRGHDEIRTLADSLRRMKGASFESMNLLQ